MPTQAFETTPYHVTPAEAEVLKLIAKGYSDSEIGAELRLKPATVSSRVHQFCERTGVHGRRLVVWSAAHLECCAETVAALKRRRPRRMLLRAG